ncbi:MAG: hypothetical protein RMK57_02900 [Bryobacterales bacterium]|nr:hypothetical protein [Bryobacteraceae bacterium]MDW8353456.1 hypothetical protein [Bryobacterales bacterium]
MPGYLESYGAEEERRERILKRIALALLAALLLGGVAYVLFRNYREVKQAERFFELLRQQDYQAAYRMWGCTEPSAPACRDYPFEAFLEDWGPKGRHSNVSGVEFKRVRGCRDGVIITVGFPKGEEELLWVQRGDRVIGFAPWPVCNPRLPDTQPAAP